NKRSFNHRILGQSFGDFAKPDLIGVRAEIEATMGRNNEAMFYGLGGELAVFFEVLIARAVARPFDARAKKSLWLIAVVFDFDDAGVSARRASFCRAHPRMADGQFARCFLMGCGWRTESDGKTESRYRDFCHHFLPLSLSRLLGRSRRP